MFLETLILEFPNFWMLYCNIKMLSTKFLCCYGEQGEEGGKVKGRNSMQCVFTVTPNSVIKLLAGLYSMGLVWVLGFFLPL